MDLREVGYDDRDWIHLAQYRERWRVYVRAEMNLRHLSRVETRKGAYASTAGSLASWTDSLGLSPEYGARNTRERRTSIVVPLPSNSSQAANQEFSSKVKELRNKRKNWNRAVLANQLQKHFPNTPLMSGRGRSIYSGLRQDDSTVNIGFTNATQITPLTYDAQWVNLKLNALIHPRSILEENGDRSPSTPVIELPSP
ncbi:hypothetical protein ANN_27018 [Periplaneta americana]|uniref:Uncharacterized protein n=1 Tax=Periplaneta americana TaxID=6978 RepID=A0ABQ8RWX8_PERAM|nr:hypothetical protein ANN_27018 [Periplaneta americana]